MTIDKRRPSPRGPLPEFAPVPRLTHRHDGWTPERQRGFIEALADTGSVKAAAHAVNMTPEGAYMLRRHPQAGPFRKAWEAALALGVQRLEDVGLERALHGVEVPVYHFGAVVGTRRVYNDRLLMFYLRNRAAKRFAADTRHPPNPVDRAALARMKREWRREWEREHHARSHADAREVRASIDAKLDQWREDRLASMSPEVRRAWDAYAAAHEAETAAHPRLAHRTPDPDPEGHE
jgi:hypothetical protein